MKWVFLNDVTEALIDNNEKILAKVTRVGFLGPWRFMNDEYISEASAKAAAEKHIMEDGAA